MQYVIIVYLYLLEYIISMLLSLLPRPLLPRSTEEVSSENFIAVQYLNTQFIVHYYSRTLFTPMFNRISFIETD